MSAALAAALAAACFVTGIIGGWLLRSVMVMAEISRSEERMQKKVQYWQSEAVYARNIAERLARQLRALGGWPPETADPSSPDDS